MPVKVTHDGVRICSGCAVIIANGDTSAPDGEARADRIDVWVSGLVGVSRPHLVVEPGDPETGGPFAEYDCETCGDPFAGELVTLTVLDES